MAYVPTSSGAIAAKKLKRMLSLSSTFLARMGDDEDVNGRISYDEVENDDLFPRALVCFGGGSAGMVAGGSQVHLRPGFTLDLYVWLTPKDPDACEEDQRLELWDASAGIFDDINELSGADDTGSFDGTGHLNIAESTWTLKAENANTDRAANGLRALAVMSFRVGNA